MPKKKTEAEQAKQAKDDAYDAAIAQYSTALDALQHRDFARAKELFAAIAAVSKTEPELYDRASIYGRICERKLATAEHEPTDAGEMYHRAVFLMNSGDVDDALKLLNRALVDDPTSGDVLYVRACAWALKGAAEKAVGDLRQAMALDPKIRFQAINDPDFEKIREEPAFIDIIEPTTAGA